VITKDIIAVLKNDTTIQTLLGAATAALCPVSAEYTFDDTVNKQINLSVEYGETIETDQSGKTHEGELRVYIMIKDSLSGPIALADSIASRVLALLDLKGTTLNATNTIYMIRKIDSDLTHYDAIHFYEQMLEFKFVETVA
jgi:hypothetical protein